MNFLTQIPTWLLWVSGIIVAGVLLYGALYALLYLMIVHTERDVWPWR